MLKDKVVVIRIKLKTLILALTIIGIVILYSIPIFISINNHAGRANSLTASVIWLILGFILSCGGLYSYKKINKGGGKK